MMVENMMSPDVRERAAQVRRRFLAERAEVLVAYSGILSLDDEHRSGLGGLLSDFNQLLTDYSAFGHFEVYELFRTESDSYEGLLEAVQANTDVLLAFADEYCGESAASHNLAQLSRALDQLGHALAERFELEDNMLSSS